MTNKLKTKIPKFVIKLQIKNRLGLNWKPTENGRDRRS